MWFIFKPDGLKKMPLLLFTNEIPLTSHKGIEKVKEL